MRAILVLLFVVAVVVASQVVMYRLEGGLKVADSYADPPLSTVFHAMFREPLSVTSRRGTSHISILERWYYWRALRKFPTLDHCVKSPAADGNDRFGFDWTSMRTPEQAQVCLHHAAVELVDPDELLGWLDSEGFAAKAYYSSGKRLPQIDAVWRDSSNGKRHPFSVISWMQINMMDPFRTGAPVGLSIELQDDQTAPIAIEVWLNAQF